MIKRVSVYRREHFNAAHRLHNPAWDEAKNDIVFGKCNNPNYHGHNYEMEVKVTGEPAADTGFVFDHKNLNLDLPEFAKLNPTVENIVIIIYDILRREIDPKLDLQIRLYETPRNFAEYPVL
jgi:6-pyruvoyltetrahydropterin/6-carboxytetrahydropterin synthase